MNSLIFTGLFITLILVVVLYTIKEKEPFEDKTPTLHVPEAPVPQKNLVEGSSEDYAPSWVLATGPAPGAIASFNSLPYQDPSLEKAKYQRILNVLTTLQGFLDNEAIHIQELSDPSIQLPLASARSDLVRLQNEVLVLRRNPGIDSTLTQGDVDEIQANLEYLQKKWRLSIYNDLTTIEGFQDSSGASLSNYSGSNYGASNYATSNYAASNYVSYSNVISNINNYTSGTSGTNTNPDTASLQDLVQLNQIIDATIARLGSSGTTDPVVLARISSLQRVKNSVQNVINNVNNGVIAEQDIPITKSAVTNFLKVASNTSSQLPNIVGSNSALLSLFPAYTSGDVNSAKLAQELANKYMDMLFNNISFDINLTYTSPAEQSLANTLITSLTQYAPNVTANASLLSSNMTAYDLNTSNNNYSSVSANSNGNVQSIFQTLVNNQNAQTSASVTSNMPSPPTHFDWQERANFICDSIQKQGMNPKDFGCLRPDEYVSENFSWRGYAKMICSRLSASMDTGLPETCGCPPPTWSGWRP